VSPPQTNEPSGFAHSEPLRRALPSGYQIALAENDQLEQCQQIELAASAVFSDEDVPKEIRLTATSLSDLASAQAKGILWVALAPDGNPVGFVIVRIVDGSAYIHEIDVHPNHGRQGIGTSLINTVCEWAKPQRIDAVTLTTFRHLSWNAPFYERLGFRSMKRDELTPGLVAILSEEAARGFDPRKRVAMLKQMGSPTTNQD
jgi:GNAT superfamily N-acetyltransferase